MMRRILHDEGSETSTRMAAQDGFTLVELLVGMLVSLVVLTGAVLGIAYAFRSTSETTARTSATNQAEVRLEVLTRDLRQASPCPANLALAASTYLDAATPANQAGLVLTSTSGTGATTILQMCDPAPGLPASQAGSEIPAQALVTWTCALATQSCLRTTQNISGAALSGSAQATNTLTGVKSLIFTGDTLAADTATTTLATLATLGTAQAATDYLLGPSSTNAAVSWVGIAVQIVNLKNPDSTSDLTAANGTAAVSVTTGVALRNYGT